MSILNFFRRLMGIETQIAEDEQAPAAVQTPEVVEQPETAAEGVKAPAKKKGRPAKKKTS